MSFQSPRKVSDFGAPPGLELPASAEVEVGAPPGLLPEGQPLRQSRSRFMSDCLELESVRLAHENMVLRAHLQAQQVRMASAMFSGAAASGLWSPESLLPLGHWTGAALVSPRVETKIGTKLDAARARSRDSTAIGSSSEESGSEDSPKTTVFMKNVPTSYTRSAFLELLDREGFAGEYDLVYLPIDFESQSCLGYAFINCLSSQIATRFCSRFQGFATWDVPSDKACEMGAAAQQGFKANVDRYRNSAVMHDSVPDECRPVIFSSGVRVPFPAPTRRLKAPQTRRRSRSSLD